jgi:hypothetical protein
MGRRSTIHLNERFSNLLVLEIIPSNKSGEHSKVRCLCDCGNETIVQSHLLKTKIKSCGCKKNFWGDLTGKTFGKLKILKIIKKNSEIKNNCGHLYLCECKECKRLYNFQASILKRKRFLGCKCDLTKKSAKLKIFYSYKKNAEKRNLKFNLNFEDFIRICENKCVYCGTLNSNTSKSSKLNEWNYNGIDRIDNNKDYTIDNVCSCCKTCNWMKNKLSKCDFLNHINKIFQIFLKL